MISSAIFTQPRTWRVDGSSSRGRRFHVLPLCTGEKVPVSRVDVMLPCQSTLRPYINAVYRTLEAINPTSDKVINLPISRYVESVLGRWSASLGDREAIYSHLPFGTLIVIGNITTQPHEARTRLVLPKPFEEHLMPLSQARASWLKGFESLPPILDISGLIHVPLLSS